MALRSGVLLIAAYVVVRKIFPFGWLENHLTDLTVGEFLLVVSRALAATVASAYLINRALRQPELQFRDRVWCERWCALAFGIIALVAGSISVVLLERKEMVATAAHRMARGILWLLF